MVIENKVWIVYEHDLLESRILDVFRTKPAAVAYVEAAHKAGSQKYERDHLEIQEWEVR